METNWGTVDHEFAAERLGSDTQSGTDKGAVVPGPLALRLDYDIDPLAAVGETLARP